MKILYLLFVLITSSPLFLNGATKSVLINKDSIINLAAYTYCFSTEDTSSNINTILDSTFSYMPNGLNIGINDKIRWGKYVFINNTGHTLKRYIYFPYNHINKIIAYTFYQKKLEKKTYAGTFYNYNKKDIESRGYPIALELKPGETEMYIYFNHLYLPFRGVSYLLTEERVKEVNFKSEKAIWFWKGIFLFALLLTFALYITTRLKLFLYYLLLNIGVGVFFAAEIGDFFILFDTDVFDRIIDIKQFGNMIILFSFPLFINEITPVKKLRPKVWKFMFYGIYIVPILWFFCLFTPVKNTYFLYYFTQYLVLGSGIIFLLQIYFVYIAYREKVKNSLSVLVAYLFYVSAVFINVILPNLGIVENSIEAYNSFIYGSIFEIFIFMGLIGKETLFIYNQRSDLLEKQKNHQTEIIKAIVESQEKERNNVGRELHDMIGANISVIKQQVDKSNLALLNVINLTMESVRDLSHGLMTPLIKDDEFIDEISDLCIMFSSLKTNVKSNFHNWKKIENPEKATHLFRIIQELLQNAIKHSNAENVLIQFITNQKNELTIMYEDDGIGFDYQTCYNNKGAGLINIENRTELINGSIIYDTKKGRKGTTIIINISN